MKKIVNFIVKHNGLIGFIIGVLGTIFAIVAYVYPISIQPKLSFFLGNQSTIAVTDKKIEGLIIKYKERDITKDNLNLYVINIKVANRGRSDIRIQDYDPSAFGLKILNSKIIGVEVPKNYMNGKNKFLSYNFKPKIIDSSSIYFNKQLFNAGDELNFNVYLLNYFEKGIPDYYAIGNIAGQNKIDVMLESDDNQLNWYDDVYIPCLAIFLILIIEIPLVLGIGLLIRKVRSWQRRNTILKLYDFPLKELNDVQRHFVRIYVDLGKKEFILFLKGLNSGSEFIKNEEECISAIKKINEGRKKKFRLFNRKINYNTSYWTWEELLKQKQHIIKDDQGKFILSEPFKTEIENTSKLLGLKPITQEFFDHHII